MSDLNNWATTAESGYQATEDPPDGFPEGKLPSVVNNVIREVMASIKRRYTDSRGSTVSTGSSGAYVVASSETVSALYDGLRVSFTANHTTTGTSTLNWGGTGVTALMKSTGAALYAGDIVANQKVDCVYDATNAWWQALSVRSSTANVVIDQFSGNGVQTAFVMSADGGTKKNVAVYISGVYQQNDTYNVSGTTLTFTEAPPSGSDNIEARVNSPAPAAAVDDDSITLSKMAGGTAGGVIAYDGSGDPVDVGAGNSGEVLTSNGSSPPSWQVCLPPGVSMSYIGLTAPTGWVLATGGTIGSAASGASERANADCESLFVVLWDSWPDNEAPVTGGRGASAAADWAADKPMAIPDMRGSIHVGLDDMGGSAAGRITTLSLNGFRGTRPGGRIGDETHRLEIDQIPAHTHGLADSSASGLNASGAADATDGAGTHDVTGSAGGGGRHSNTQPGLMWSIIIKL